MGSSGGVVRSARNVLWSPSANLILPESMPSLRNLALPDPDIGSNSHAPFHVNEIPVFVGLQFTWAIRASMRRRSAYPVSEITAVPRRSRSSLPHCEVSTMRHQPLYSGGISLSCPYGNITNFKSRFAKLFQPFDLWFFLLDWKITFLCSYTSCCHSSGMFEKISSRYISHFLSLCLTTENTENYISYSKVLRESFIKILYSFW